MTDLNLSAIEMDSIQLHQATPADAEALLAIYRPYILNSAITFEYTVPSVEEFASRIQNITSFYPYLVARCGAQVLGFAYASAFHSRAAFQWCAEMSIYLDSSAQGLGVGRTLYTVLESLLKQQNVAVVTAAIAISSDHDTDPYLPSDSEAFHRRMGYQRMGHFPQCGYKFDRWYDLIWMEKRLSAPQSAPQPIIPVDRLWANNPQFGRK